MPIEDIDDLFRDRLAGHVTPPGEALWARLPAGTGKPIPAEPIHTAHPTPDHLFQRGLGAHATPPGRELWERLEDEHLRPRRRRAAAWWPRALVAALALLLVAGGAGLWRDFLGRNAPGGNVARPAARANHPAGISPAPDPTIRNAPAGLPDNVRQTVAGVAPTAGRAAASPALKKLMARTTRARAFASTAPTAHRAIPGPAPRRATPPAPLRTSTADERRLAPEAGPAVAATPLVLPPTAPAPAAALASRGDLITVDVRNGADPAAGPVLADDARRAGTTAAAPAENQRLGGRLLHQASHLLRGERLNLAEVTGLAETLTLRATVAGHRLTKTIQL